MSAWDELVTTALLGTDRRALPERLPPAVARLSEAQGDRGLAVLDAAAGLASYRHAGARPGVSPDPPPAPRQRLDLAPEPAQLLLADLLASRQTTLVEEWLRGCTDRGLGVRAGLWTRVLDAAGAASGPDRVLVLRALGERGRAFAELNPRWRPVLRPGSPTAPAPAPASPTLTVRAQHAVRVTRSAGLSPRGHRATVVPPAFDEALAAAGVPPRPPRGSSLSPGAHLLRRVVAGADLSTWPGHTGLAPHRLLDVLRSEAQEWYPDLVDALAEATTAQGDAEWALALLRAGQGPAELTRLVSADDLVRVVDGWVGSRGDANSVARLLAAVPSPWPERVAEAALRHLVSTRPSTSLVRRLERALGHAAPPSFLGRVIGRGLPEAERLLAIRWEMVGAFDTAAAPVADRAGDPQTDSTTDRETP